MKYKRLLIFISFLFIMFLSTINVNAAENVKIKSIDLVDKSENTTEINKATFDGLTMNFGLKFMSVDDYAKYKVVVQNSENKDYKISIDSNFGNSKYIAYDYVKADSLKANSDTEFYVTVSYKNEVSESDFSNGKYNEKNSAVLKLSNGSISNPVTSNDMILILVSLLVIAGVLYVLYSNKKNIKLNVFVLLSLLSIPLFVKAVDYLKITVNSSVVIEKGYSVAYEFSGYIKAREIDNYNLSEALFIDTVYSGSVSEENKYLFYIDMIYKGKKKFAPGSNINIKDTEFPISYYFINDECKCSDGSSRFDCDSTKDRVCGSPIQEDNEFSDGTLMYSYEGSEFYGYKVNDDDNTVMKFLNANDSWDSEKRIYINMNTSFTMSNHDVLFTAVGELPN